MKLFFFVAAFFSAALAAKDYPELYDKIYLLLQHDKKDPSQVFTRIRLRWDEDPDATQYQVCRNCQIDEYGHELDKSVGSLYTFVNDNDDETDPYFICDGKRDRHHCVGHIFQRGAKVSYFSVRAKNKHTGWTRFSPPKRYGID